MQQAVTQTDLSSVGSTEGFVSEEDLSAYGLITCFRWIAILNKIGAWDTCEFLW